MLGDPGGDPDSRRRYEAVPDAVAAVDGTADAPAKRFQSTNRIPAAMTATVGPETIGGAGGWPAAVPTMRNWTGTSAAQAGRIHIAHHAQR
jgi:hypothetical protein